MKNNSKFILFIFLTALGIYTSMNIKIKVNKVSNMEYKLPEKYAGILLSSVNGSVTPNYVKNIKLPKLQPNEVLVKVKAASLSSMDREIFKGKKQSNSNIPCFSFSGIVVNKHESVENFYISDEVYGKLDRDQNGACAEYVVVSKNQIALKPRTLNHFNAAAVPYSSLIAQAIVSKLSLKQGDMVFINEALSGEGIMFTRFAEIKGVKTIGRDLEEQKKYLKHIGIDDFVSKTERIPLKFKESLHYVVDFSTEKNESESLCKLLNKKGVLITRHNAKGSSCKDKKIIQLKDLETNIEKSNLTQVSSLFQSGQLTTKLEKVFSLKNFAPAYELLMSNKELDGKIIINISGKY